MADSRAPADTPLERGIAALYTGMGPDASLWLERVTTRSDEAASFDYVLPEDWTGTTRTLRLGFPKTFPRHGLRVRVDPSPWLVWPHAIKDELCLFGPHQRPASGTPEEIVHDTMRRIQKLLELIVPAADPDDRQREFADEIMTYWNWQLPIANQQLLLLRRPAQAQALFALTDKRPHPDLVREPVLLADNPEVLGRYWERMTLLKQPVKAPATPAFFLPLETLPSIEVPPPGHVLSWLRPHVGQEAYSALEAWNQEQGAQPIRWLILQLPDANPPMLQALVLRGRGMRRDGSKAYGRRAGRRGAPTDTAAPPPMSLESARVQLLDRKTVHSRDPTADDPRLANAHVVLVGAGSLGSKVATQLARAGLGRLSIIDPDVLVDANLGRHVLGADELGRSKAKALRERLRRDVPTLEVDAWPTYVQEVLAKKSEIIADADLVVVTTADWPSEVALWEAKARGATWRIIQAWSEPNAQVGQVLFAPAGAFDARSLFESNGRFRFRYSDWKDDGVRPLPGCGASYIPGGPLGLGAISSMVAQVAIKGLTTLEQAAWFSSVGSPSAIVAAGGSYLGPELPQGMSSVVMERQWPIAVAP